MMKTMISLLFFLSMAAPEVQFRQQEIQRDFGVGYAVLIADVNSDRRSTGNVKIYWNESK